METNGFFVVCEQTLIDDFRAQVIKLHPRKRKNWKGYLTSKFGQKSPVIYKPDTNTFYNKNWGQWCPIQSIGEMMKVMDDSGIEEMSPYMKNYLTMKEEIEDDIGRKLNDNEHDYLTHNMCEIHQEKTQTGNHIPNSMRETHGYGILRK